MSHVLSPRARADLDGIWDYSVEQWSESQAEHYIRELWQAIEFVTADPRRGRACDDIRAGYQKYPAGRHVLFFRLTATGIDVVRILHGSMDFGRHL